MAVKSKPYTEDQQEEMPLNKNPISGFLVFQQHYVFDAKLLTPTIRQ